MVLLSGGKVQGYALGNRYTMGWLPFWLWPQYLLGDSPLGLLAMLGIAPLLMARRSTGCCAAGPPAGCGSARHDASHPAARRRRLAPALVLLLAAAPAAAQVLAVATPSGSEKAIAALLEQANCWRQQNRPDQVVRALDRVLAVDPRNPRRWPAPPRRRRSSATGRRRMR